VMAMLHADLVGTLQQGRNNQNQRGFQYILSVMDLATSYLWLLLLCHKTAEAVAAVLFDGSHIQSLCPVHHLDGPWRIHGREVVEGLYKRLGITHLWTSAYHPQTDAKCERVQFSVQNMITKLVGDKHERWPNLLGTFVLAYNAMVHSMTGYSPHELFYSFAPACPLDAMVTAPVLEPAGNADDYALQALERLQKVAVFIQAMTGNKCSG